MAALKRGSHQSDIAHAFERIIGAADLIGIAFGHVHKVRDEIGSNFSGIDKMRHAEALAPALLVRIYVDADDHCGADQAKPLDHVQADAAKAKDNAFGAGLDFCGIDHGANAGGYAAADVTDLVERCVLADFGHRDLGQHGEIREG